MKKRIYQQPAIQLVNIGIQQMITTSGSGSGSGDSSTIIDVGGGDDGPGYGGGGNGDAYGKRGHFYDDPFNNDNFWDSSR